MNPWIIIKINDNNVIPSISKKLEIEINGMYLHLYNKFEFGDLVVI